ncbi:hypothetical protein [Aeromonas veronii]|uniref:hypothetical protein n=1 Tax=Aeromonas TaxID=642 RepID=UPI00131886E7|nr:hypothetical protein [Aeromonas veronii]MCF5718295.1 hypothetical protein [Aeromonas veronii]MCF5910485.1 hypothetical protein [Aeromonas veronii]QHC09496.1 hypothetical protein GRF56_19985 [Aeromonas veronii]
MAINNEKDLGKALNEDQDTIEIEGSLRDKVIKIKATGKVAWVIAIGAIGVAVVAILYPVPEPATQASAKGIAALTGGAAVGILGAGTAMSAIAISVASGGVAALNKLRSYKIISNSGDKLVLKKS